MSIEAGARSRLQGLAAAGYPAEVCGLLVAEAGSPERVIEVWPLRNTAAEPQHAFAFDPMEYLVAERQADARALKVVGIWHTHPNAPAVPSRRDLEEAWAEWVYLIIRTESAGAAQMRAWRLCGDSFVEEVLEP
jgi:proteasome lid subunit RPN8/RPN11